MYQLIFLIVFPFAAGLVLLFPRNDAVRSRLIKFFAVTVCAGSVILFVSKIGFRAQYFEANSFIFDRSVFFIELALAAYIFYTGLKHRRPLTVILILAQTAIMAVFEIFFRENLTIEYNLFVDKLSLLMTLVVGVVGSLVMIYAIGYMRDYHKSYHRDVKDHRPFFFFVMFAFLSAMFGIVFSNNLLWLYFFWELTTLASFILIGYRQTRDVSRHAFHALELNLIAGVAFALAIVYLYFSAKTAEIDKIIALGHAGVLIPVALLCFSGLVKSAQFPFASWLIGAMVAPTPVSALLHSSTMVKAGIYIMLRFAHVLENTLTGFMLALIGGVTFFIGSLAAVSESNSKGVLAYSTVANLGLIVLCAGIATYEGMWAAFLLIIFHAVAKSLLFLTVGTVDNKMHSTDIERMTGLIARMPKTAVMMQIGIAGMFLAPFGMLISKWAALRAMLDYNPILAGFVIFGGSAMVFFWVRWIGRLITITQPYENVESGISQTEWIPLYGLSALTLLACILFPAVCNVFVEPYLLETYGTTVRVEPDNVIIMVIMMTMILLFPLALIRLPKRARITEPYLSGVNTGGANKFLGAMGAVKNIEMRNYYLVSFFREDRVLKMGVVISIIFIAVMFWASAT